MPELAYIPALFRANDKNAQHVKIQNTQAFFLYLKLLLISLIFILNCQPTHAAEISLAWNSTDGATGYKLYYGFESSDYPFVVDVGLSTQCTVSDLDLGRSYYFTVTAYNDYVESDFSWELGYTFNPCNSDINIDGDIDGSNLADIAADPSTTSLGDLAAG